jgi:hypothetical protein
MKGWKHYLGLGLLAYSCLPILSVELVGFLPVSSAQAVTIGAVYIATGEAAFLLAAALLGKPFVQAVKAKVWGWFKRAPGPARPVGRVRHYLGVVMFFASFLPYLAAEGWLIFGGVEKADSRGLLCLLLASDLLFVASLFVLGEGFWTRLKELFAWREGA